MTEYTTHGLIKSWISKAETDYKIAEKLFDEEIVENVLTEGICFHCQQCAEKYLKAYLVFCEYIFPKTHDIDQLINLCTKFDEMFLQLDITDLSDFGVEIRYPNFYIPTIKQAREAFERIEKIKEFVLVRID